MRVGMDPRRRASRPVVPSRSELEVADLEALFVAACVFADEYPVAARSGLGRLNEAAGQGAGPVRFRTPPIRDPNRLLRTLALEESLDGVARVALRPLTGSALQVSPKSSA